MTGEKQIIKARMQGVKPIAVFLEAGLEPMPPRSKYDDPEKALHFGLYPTVVIGTDEISKRLDLRFLAGLRVHVSGAAMSDEFLSLVDAIASLAEHVVAIAGGEIIEFKNNEVNAWIS